MCQIKSLNLGAFWCEIWRGSVSQLPSLHIVCLPACLRGWRDSREDWASPGLSNRQQAQTDSVCVCMFSFAYGIHHRKHAIVRKCEFVLLQVPRDPSHMECISPSYSSFVNKQQETADTFAFIKFSAWHCFLRRCWQGFWDHHTVSLKYVVRSIFLILTLKSVLEVTFRKHCLKPQKMLATGYLY